MRIFYLNPKVHTTLTRSSKKIYWEERLVFVETWEWEGLFSEQAREIAEWITQEDRISKWFNEWFEWELAAWLDPKDKERRNFWSFNEYLRYDIWEHAAAAWTIAAFLDDNPEAPKMPKKLKVLFEGLINNPDAERVAGSGIKFKDEIKETIKGLDKKDKQMYEAFRNAIEINNIRSYEAAKKEIAWYFNGHVDQMKINTDNFVENKKIEAVTKYKKLRWFFPNSEIVKSLESELKDKFKSVKELYLWMDTKLGSDALISWINKEGKERKEKLYYLNLIKHLTKNDIFLKSDADACFDWENKDKINISETKKRIKDFWRKGIKKFDDNIWSLSWKAYREAVSQVSLEHYQEYIKKVNKVESDIDFIFSQYDEYIEIWEQFSPKFKNQDDCVAELKTLPRSLFSDSQINTFTSLIDSWFEWAKETIRQLKEQWVINEDQKITILDRLGSWIEITKSDPLFWSILWNDLSKIVNEFYKKFMTESEAEDFDKSDDDDKKKNKQKTPLQMIKEMDPYWDNPDNSIEALYSKLLWTWGESTDFWLFQKALDILEEHKKWSPDVQNAITQLLLLKTRVLEAKLKNDELLAQYKELENKEDKTEIDKRSMDKLKLAMQVNWEVAAEWEMICKLVISKWQSASKKVTEVNWYSLMDAFNAFKNLKASFELIESRSKMKWHTLAWNVSKGIPWLKQLSSSELSQANQEFNSLVDKWATWFKKMDRKQVYEELINSKNWGYKKDHLQAVIVTLSEKWALQIVDNVFVDALNNWLPSWIKIDKKHFINTMSMAERETVLRSKFNIIFWDNELAQKVITENDSNFKSKAEKAVAEFNRLWASAWERTEWIFKNYLKLWKKLKAFDSAWQIRPWEIINFWDDDSIESATFEESVFYCLLEVNYEPRQALFYLIRAFATWLLPINRISEFEWRGLFSKLSYFQMLRWKPLSLYKELDRILTNDWKDKNATEEWIVTEDIENRVWLVIRRLTDTDGWNRSDRNLKESSDTDPDIWRDVFGKVTFWEFKSQIAESAKWWIIKINARWWQNLIMWLNEELFTFWKDYQTWEIDKKMQNIQVDNLVNTLQVSLATSAIKEQKTWMSSARSSDLNPLGIASLEKKAVMTIWSNDLTTRENLHIIWNIAKDVLSQVAWWEKILSKVYWKENEASYFSWFKEESKDDEKETKVSVSFDEEYNQVMNTQAAKDKLIEVVEKYQKNWWIPAINNNNKARECLTKKGLFWTGM